MKELQQAKNGQSWRRPKAQNTRRGDLLMLKIVLVFSLKFFIPRKVQNSRGFSPIFAQHFRRDDRIIENVSELDYISCNNETSKNNHFRHFGVYHFV